MGRTCTVKVVCGDRNGVISERSWSAADVMKLAHTYAWCTRQMNTHKHDGVYVEWECKHDNGLWFRGRKVRIQGTVMKRGFFEYL